MAKPSAKRRQQARQSKAARRRERKARRPALMSRSQSARALLRASASWPLHECLLAKEWQKEGAIIQILVARRSAAGQIAAGAFLVDPCCLGVKNAFARLFDLRRDYERELRDGMVEAQEMIEAGLNHVAKIIRDTIAYAKGLGFKPNADYRYAMQVLGRADPDACDVPIQLGGADGRPIFFSGPRDNVDRIMAKLTRSWAPMVSSISFASRGMRAYSEGIEKGAAAMEKRGRGVVGGALRPPTTPLPAFLTCTACRRKCAQQRNCRGDEAPLVILHPPFLPDD